MIAIHKYPIEEGFQGISLPEGARILTVMTQGNKPFIWVEVDLDTHVIEHRQLLAIATGKSFATPSELRRYIGTYLLSNANAYHLFEIR
jgi:hypothetical protein